MTTPTKLPETIQASIHQDALSRVPSFFNATIREILNELLQNSRRAGATRVDITTTPESMTIADNGQGVADPRTLLAFGQTGWEEDTVRNEHPAGMGLYTLARREKVTVRSNCGDGTAWQVSLTPDHFTGKLPAPVEELDGREITAGTSITFETNRNERQLEGDIQEAARYYPLPVYHNGARMEGSNFLEGALHTETWEGVRIGVFRGGTAKMNFHGVVVQDPPLPSVRDIETKNWTVKVEVEDCPGLELTLPARKEEVETPFMEELRTACRRAIYRAMAESSEPVDVPREVQERARRLGVTLPDARPRLAPWAAAPANYTRSWSSSKRNTVQVDDNTLVMDAYLEAGDQQTLERAASRNGMTDRLLQGNGDLIGYRWYDELQHIQEVQITITENGEEKDLRDMRDRNDEPEGERPDGITFTLRGDGKEGQEPFELSLPSDLAFLNEEEDGSEENRPLVTRESDINVQELTELIMDSFFCPSDDYDTDSYETQKEGYRENAERTAMTILLDKDETSRRQIEKALREHVVWEIPRGTQVTIHISRGERDTEISIEQG